MSDREEYIKELEARIEELEGVIENYVDDNADNRSWMVIDTETGLFWRGGDSRSFSKTGKAYTKAGYARSALRNHCPKPDSYYNTKHGGYRSYTKNWKVVETANIITRTFELKDFLGD